MKTLAQPFNPSACATDWRHYEVPTVLRRQGRVFLERSWAAEAHRHKPITLFSQPPYSLSKPELERLVISYGGVYLPTSDHPLLLFDDVHWARRCHAQLNKLGVSTQRWGCHIQLSECP